MFRVNRQKKLTLQERSAIVAHTNAGCSIRAISRMVGCADSTVIAWQRRFDETGNVLRKTGTGLLNKKTTFVQDLHIRRAVEDNPITTAHAIASNLFSLGNSFFSLAPFKF